MKFFFCYTGTNAAGARFEGNATITADALTDESIAAAREWIVKDLKRNHRTVVKGLLVFTSIIRLDG